MKNGFTLVELLAVIVLIAIIAVISVGGINKVKNNIKSDICKSTVEMIQNGAIHYGEDNENLLKTENGCSIYNSYRCISVKVEDLINSGYLNVKENEIKDENNVIIGYKTELTNELTGESLNQKNVEIYIESGRVYSELINVDCNG